MFGPALPTFSEALVELRQGIADRAVVKMRENVSHGIGLIKNRKKHEIIHVTPHNHDQKAWFTKLESNNIWEYVMSYLTNPVDITSASLACGLFKKHLEKRRLHTLLPSVLETLRTKDERIHTLRKDRYESKRNTCLDFLHLRCVSQQWKNAFERTMFFPCDMYCRQLGICNEAIRFSTIEHVERAIEVLGSSSTCSNVLKGIRVEPHGLSAQATATFFSRLRVLLEIHSASVRALYFDIFCKEGLHDSNYKYFCELLVIIPKLEYMRVNMHVSRVGDHQFADRLTTQRILRDHPFPTLPHLQGCAVEINEELDLLFLDILSRNKNLTSIYIIWERFLMHNGDLMGRNRIPEVIWIALRMLPLQNFVLIFTAAGSESFRQELVQLRQCDWQLRYLELALISTVPDVLDANDIFETVCGFSTSLETAKAAVCQLRIYDTQVYPRFDFPSLKEIDFIFL